ncbi:MAG: long-chain fatty acid--CoA ligase [Candidatus Alcyoniella australis]|nr:long-chain fatty acid--CoA ligase [Candidatus Alcyoniella australis]
MSYLPETTSIRVLKNRADRWPDAVCVKQKRDGRWLSMTWSEMMKKVAALGTALCDLGLKSGQTVGIAAGTCVEWMLSDFAAVSSGGITVGLYTTSATEQMRYTLWHSETRILVVQNRELLKKIRPALDELENLKSVIVIDPAGCDDLWPGYRSFNGLIQEIQDSVDVQTYWNTACESINDPERPITYIYTSGTTGPPKAAMLCDRNLLAAVEVYSAASSAAPGDSLISVLPLSHGLQRVLDFTALAGGSAVCYVESLKTLVQDMQEIQPTMLGGVPRLLEKVFESVQTKAESGGSFKRKVFRWSLNVAREFGEYYQSQKVQPLLFRLKHKLATALVFGKVSQAMGGRIRFVGSGGASLSVDIAKFFMACGIPVMEAYGMTETSVVGSLNLPGEFKFGTVGRVSKGAQIKIAEDGEILIRGDCLFLGYYKMDPAASSTLYRDGWFLTGDVGEMDADGYLKITDRKKELIITAYSENIAPSNIEATLNLSPLVAGSLVYGDEQKYIIALIDPDRERLRARIEELGLANAPSRPLHETEAARNLIAEAVDQANSGLSGPDRVRKFALLPAAFSIETGEFTPTLKLKRRNIISKYKALIRSCYGADWKDRSK